MLPEEFWDKKHESYRKKEWIHLPTHFAEEVIDQLPPGATLLDLGCGQGQDSLYFAEAGFHVTAADFSKFALDHFPPSRQRAPVTLVLLDMADLPYPFDDSSFDVVYSHLSLHYFDEAATSAIVRELHRILRPGGLLCVMVNSVDDPECGEGEWLEPDFYELTPGDRKRYFSQESLDRLTGAFFAPRLLEQSGRTRKDPHRAFVRMVAERREKVSRD